MDIFSFLRENSYPGRGILLGRLNGGAFIAYFIMGRSANSRNRVFTEKDGGIITEAADTAKLEAPSLIIYAPVRRAGNVTIVTNGDQTDTVYDALQRGGSFEGALRTRTFEPDAPNYTPRISGMVEQKADGFAYKLSILKSAGGNAASAQRFFFEYLQPQENTGHFIHTYESDGDPLPSFMGEPRRVELNGTFEGLGEELWNSLDKNNKVSLFLRHISPDGAEKTKIYNLYQKK